MQKAATIATMQKAALTKHLAEAHANYGVSFILAAVADALIDDLNQLDALTTDDRKRYIASVLADFIGYVNYITNRT